MWQLSSVWTEYEKLKAIDKTLVARVSFQYKPLHRMLFPIEDYTNHQTT